MHDMQIWRRTSFSSIHKTHGIVRLHEREYALGFCPFLNQEHNHDQKEVETLRDDEDLPSCVLQFWLAILFNLRGLIRVIIKYGTCKSSRILMQSFQYFL